MIERNRTAFECDHMKPVASIEGHWYHILESGELAETNCTAGVYTVLAIYRGQHYAHLAVPRSKDDDNE